MSDTVAEPISEATAVHRGGLVHRFGPLRADVADPALQGRRRPRPPVLRAGDRGGSQRGEVIDLNRYRTSHDLAIPDGFTDPLEDQRLDTLSLTGS